MFPVTHDENQWGAIMKKETQWTAMGDQQMQQHHQPAQGSSGTPGGTPGHQERILGLEWLLGLEWSVTPDNQIMEPVV